LITLDKFLKQENNINNVAKKDVRKQYNILYENKLTKKWKVVELAEIFSEANKNLRKIRIKDNETYKMITVKLYAKGLTLRDIKLGKDIKTKTMFKVKEGDFIFSKIDARNGAYGFVPPELDGAVVSSDFPILVLDRSKAIDKFVYYYMSQPIVWETIRTYAVGTTNRKRIKPSEFLKIIKIPLPPLEEQHRIVRVLDTVKHAIEVQDKLLDTFMELKRALMDRLFTKGLNPNQSTKQTEIGETPAHWKVVSLGEILSKRNETITPQEAQKLGLVYVGLEHIDSGMPFLYRCDNPSKARSLKNRFHRLDILYGRLRPYLDKAAIAECEGICSTDILVLRADKSKVNPLFAVYLLHTERFLKYATSLMKGVNHPRVTWNDIKKFKFALPPLHEQEKIASTMVTIDKKIMIIKQKKSLLEELFNSLLHKLMSGQIRVTNLDEVYSSKT